MERIVIALKKSADENIEAFKELIEEYCFSKKDVYVDLQFKSRPTPSFLQELFDLVFDYQTIIINSFEYIDEPSLVTINHHFYSGETWHIKHPTILIGDIHKDALVYLNSFLYVHGEIKGTIVFENSSCVIYGDKYCEARIINHQGIERLFSGRSEVINANKGGKVSWHGLSLLPVVKEE